MTNCGWNAFGVFNDLIAEPLEPTVIDNAVVVIGPGPLSFAMTPDAAEISGLRLMEAADKARRKF